MVLIMLIMGPAGFEKMAAQEIRTPMTQIFADQKWYCDHPIKERSWEGIVTRRVIGLGPADRMALTLALKTVEEEIPLYTAGVEEKLEPFVDKQVKVIGKLVDLENEGFGPEIWIGAIDLLNVEKP